MLILVGYIIYARQTSEFTEHESWVYAIDNNRQNTTASAGGNDILLWNQRHCIGTLSAHTQAVKSVAFSTSGDLLVSGSIDKTTRVWSVKNRKVINTLNAHSEGVNKVQFDTSGNLVISAGYDDKLLIWNWQTNEIRDTISCRYTGFSISASNMLAYIDTTCHIHLLNLNSFRSVQLPGQYCGILSLAFHPKQNILAVHELNTSTFTFINSATGQLIDSLNVKDTGSALEVEGYCFTPDGKMYDCWKRRRQ